MRIAAFAIEPSPDPRAVAARLGHSRPSLVLDVYGHLLPAADEALTEAAEALIARRN